MSKEEFVRAWCDCYHTTEEAFYKDKDAIPCGCNHPGCEGWSAVRKDSGEYRQYLAAKAELDAARTIRIPPYERDCSTGNIRGLSADMIAMDEVAHFNKNRDSLPGPPVRGKGYLNRVQKLADIHQRRRHGASVDEMKAYIHRLESEMLLTVIDQNGNEVVIRREELDLDERGRQKIHG